MLLGRLKQAADVMGIRLLDFLVIGSSGKYYSAVERGAM
jgi:DNA repair protein RadC